MSPQSYVLDDDQFSYLLKHSMRPLVQLQIPPWLCHPGKLCFAKSDLSTDELYEQKAINIILPRPHHPKLDSIEQKHATRALAAAVHYTLRQRLFDKFCESQSGVADLFLVEWEKFYTSISGRTYDAGKKPTKAERHEKEAKEFKARKQKLKAKELPKEDKQEKEKEDILMYTDKMPELESNSENDNQADTSKGARKKK